MKYLTSENCTQFCSVVGNEKRVLFVFLITLYACLNAISGFGTIEFNNKLLFTATMACLLVCHFYLLSRIFSVP